MGDIYADIFGDSTAQADLSADILPDTSKGSGFGGWGGWGDFLSTTGQNLIGAKAARMIGSAPVARSPGGVDFVEGKPVKETATANGIFSGIEINTVLMIAAGLALLHFVMKSN